jgi:excinuclease UvrABC nuclease subunit
MSDTQWLTNAGFKRVGCWSSQSNKLQHLVVIAKSPSVYTFVVNRELFYLGKATRLRSRLRQYNRALSAPSESRPFRAAHKGIGAVVKSRDNVEVWVFEHPGEGETRTIGDLERAWITEKRPLWNGTLKLSK